jgi:hypothetical protein
MGKPRIGFNKSLVSFIAALLLCFVA